MPKRPEEPEHRSKILHVRVTPTAGDKILRVAGAERRKVSEVASILLDEALEARARRAAR